jgi:DHA1 family bicyclomycin/chloramphenicol resistance-like MFS transporter
VTFYYVAAYAFITGSPFVYITYFGIDAQHYGWLFAVNVLGLMAVSMVNRRLVHRYPLESLLQFAVVVAAVAALILALCTKLELGGITMIILSVFVFFSMNGIVAATSTAAAMDTVPNMAGSASAFIGSLQYGSGIISSLLLALLSDGTPWTMGWIIALFTVASAVMAVAAATVRARS